LKNLIECVPNRGIKSYNFRFAIGVAAEGTKGAMRPPEKLRINTGEPGAFFISVPHGKTDYFHRTVGWAEEKALCAREKFISVPHGKTIHSHHAKVWAERHRVPGRNSFLSHTGKRMIFTGLWGGPKGAVRSGEIYFSPTRENDPSTPRKSVGRKAPRVCPQAGRAPTFGLVRKLAKYAQGEAVNSRREGHLIAPPCTPWHLPSGSRVPIGKQIFMDEKARAACRRSHRPGAFSEGNL
jgi:hypothetical protein